MGKQKREVLRVRMVLASLLLQFATSLVLVSSGRSSETILQITVEVTKVYDSPKIWAGTITTNQQIDVLVRNSQNPGFGIGSRLHIRVPLVRGNALFDSKVPQFSARQVYPQALLLIRTGTECIQNGGPSVYTVDPSCITPLAKSASSRSSAGKIGSSSMMQPIDIGATTTFVGNG